MLALVTDAPPARRRRTDFLPEDAVPHEHACETPGCGRRWRHTRKHAVRRGRIKTHTCALCGARQFKRVQPDAAPAQAAAA